MSKKLKGGLESLVMFSTNPDFKIEQEEKEEISLDKKQQKLIVRLETKHRGGKAVTIVDGFIGSESELETLGKLLKTKCGTGGSVKDGIALVQGDFRQKVVDILLKEGYTAKRGN